MSAQSSSPGKIYCFINNKWGTSDLAVIAVAETGEVLAQHISSGLGWAQTDIGYVKWEEGGVGIGASQHDAYRKRFPDGYEMEWVHAPKEHLGVQAAQALANAEVPA